MRHLTLSLWVSALVFASAACAVNEAAFAPAPVAPAARVVWAAPGAGVVVDGGAPLYVVGDDYWLWREDRWLVWRGLGWQRADAPAVLEDLGPWWRDRSWMQRPQAAVIVPRQD